MKKCILTLSIHLLSNIIWIIDYHHSPQGKNQQYSHLTCWFTDFAIETALLVLMFLEIQKEYLSTFNHHFLQVLTLEQNPPFVRILLTEALERAED
ncbi:MAG: hypothetical protein C5S41_09590 [Candidatus Methanomarinus sp.]|nr:MAG: hypothetical protein C5S41_09590 [ANME-2 cluster archaeon]KAF5424938.1 hypothetical protein C5S42_11965 [ANME-2 cluster archaeon]